MRGEENADTLMYGTLTKDSKGQITSPLSSYQPAPAVREITLEIQQDVEDGDNILNRPFEEYNGLSFIQRGNEDQKNWLSWMPAPSDDPEDNWRWYGTRPITRNKIISTAAHLTAQLIRPSIFAQNENDEDDKDATEVADILLDYNIRHSNYETAFLYGVVSGLVNPVSYFQVNYTLSEIEILDGTAKAYERKKVIDEEQSGFQHALVPFDEVLFANPYEFSLQKQRFIIHKKRVSYHDLEMRYRWHSNWQHVQVGLKSIAGENGLFYDVEDINDELCEEVIAMHRTKDRQICFINGIYFGDNNPDFNPMLHRTPKNKPKYNLVKYGAEPVDTMRFFGYKSLAAKMANDQALADRMWNLSMDGTFLDTLEPLVTIGAGKIDRSVMVPATVTDLPRDAQVVSGLRRGNTQSAFQALREVERSMSESSLDVQLQGQASSPNKTARGAILEQNNAETNLGLIGRMIGVMAVEVGQLKMEDILRYQTVGDVMEIVGGMPKMKYKSFLVDKQKQGRTKTSIVRFTDAYAYQMSKEDTDLEALKLYEKAGDDKEIYMVNPEMLSKYEFLFTFDYEQMLKRNTSFERAFKLEAYDRAIQNPYVDQEAITRDFLLEPLVKGEAARYVKNTEEVLRQITPKGGETSGMTKRMVGSAMSPELSTG